MNIDKVVGGVEDEVARLLKDGVKPEETGTRAEGLPSAAGHEPDETMRRSSVNWLRTCSWGAPSCFRKNSKQRVQSLTVEAVNEAVRKYIDPARFFDGHGW